MTKKPYIKPTVSKVEIDSDVIKMLTKQGFADLFWQRLQEARKIDPCATQEDVFNTLNSKYTTAIGCSRYSCYDSFRNVRDKK
jgi:hypothetical protein